MMFGLPVSNSNSSCLLPYLTFQFDLPGLAVKCEFLCMCVCIIIVVITTSFLLFIVIILVILFK